jgi:multimeric flavodoxin WrbA
MKVKALILNCTLKKSPETSNTKALIDKVTAEYHKLGVETECLRLVDYDIKPGVSSNEGDGDEWPLIFEKIKSCDILIIGSPIWPGGPQSSVCVRLLERLNSLYHEKELMDPETGQFVVYNKVGGVVVTGNEDGAHNVSANVLWALEEYGFTIPANVTTYWIGDAGPGPSYIKAEGEKHLYTNKTLRYMVHNTTFMARLLKKNPYPTNLKQLTKEAEEESTSLHAEENEKKPSKS